MLPINSSDTIVEAMWEGNVTRLHVLAPCKCCCYDHTFEYCSARAWNGCKGQGNSPEAERESWVRHYQAMHSMSREEFFA